MPSPTVSSTCTASAGGTAHQRPALEVAAADQETQKQPLDHQEIERRAAQGDQGQADARKRRFLDQVAVVHKHALKARQGVRKIVQGNNPAHR